MQSGVAAAEEAALLRGLIEQTPAVTYVEPVGGRTLDYVSPQVEPIFGYPRAQWVTVPGFRDSRVHPDDAVYVQRARAHSARSGTPFAAEYRMLAADGRVVWIHDQAVPVAGADGRDHWFQGILVDVTFRRSGEEALRRSEARYRALVEASPDAIVVADRDGTVLMANESAAAMTGVAHASHMVGRSLLDWVPADECGRVAAALADAMAGENVRVVEFALEGERGERIPVEANAEAIAGDRGNDAVLAVLRDVSERRAAEEARQESDRKSRFLATMSHELRTPLNSILGFAQLLESREFGSLTERQERYVGHIEASGRHLLELVNEVLDLAKVASGEMQVAIERQPLRELVEEAVARLRPLAAAKGVTVDVDLDATVAVLADRRRLIQVVWNLLSNALKFTATGGSVAVRARRDGPAVAITVTDTGVGIPAEALSRIFDEFFQVESGRARGQEGTGLGLALTRQLVELMRGRIDVESRVGEGSAFTVVLPAAPYHGDRERPLRRGAPAAAGVGPGLRHPRGQASA